MPQGYGRTYDPALVDAIAAGVAHVDFEGIDEELRPIPDDAREHVLDPRILDTTLKKMAGLIPSMSAGGLMEQRHRLKETHFIHTGQVARELRLLDFGDRAIPATILTPATAPEKAPVVLFVHGGGFTVGWFGIYEAALTAIADLAGCVVVFPEVRLAPEARFPAQTDDAVATLDWILEHAADLGVDPSKLVVAGDSAGGSLCNGTCLKRADKIALAFPIYAGCDIRVVPEYWSYDLYPVIAEQADAAKNRVDNIKSWVGDTNYVGAGNEEVLDDPIISAMKATDEQLSSFPRTVVVCSEYDYLRVEDEKFASRLARCGVDVRLVRYQGMEHGFLEITGTCPQSEDLCRLMAEEIRSL